MTNIIDFTGETRLDLDADRALEGWQGKLDGFVMAGWGKDGKAYFSSTYANGGDALWLLELCKIELLNSRI